MNEKGIATPFLIWAILGLFAVVAANKAGLIQLNLNQDQTLPQVSPTPVTTTPKPTIDPAILMGPIDRPANDPSLTEETPQPVNTNPVPQPTTSQAATHDGSRTGPIVKYFEMAKGQEISVYENELLPYTFPNGEKSYLTQGDITWYERKNNKLLPCNIDNFKIGTNEYSNCLKQNAAALGNPVIPPAPQRSNYQWPQTYRLSYPTYSPPPNDEFGKGYVEIRPSISGSYYNGYDSAGNSVMLKPNSLTGGLSGTDSNGNYIELRPSISGTQLEGYTKQGSYYLKPNSLNNGFSGTGY